MKLAEKVDTAPNYIAMIETGRKFPSDRLLERIAQALNVRAVDLFTQQSDNIVSLQIGLIRNIHNEILGDITTLMANRIDALEK
jgi:transcriptional regulator with XRE-family HTH domain